MDQANPIIEIKELDEKWKVKRDEKGKFKGGVPNPKGRPKGSISVTGLIKSMLKERPDYKKALGARIMELALSGNEQIIKLIWNYFDGMPVQRTEIASLDLNGLLERIEKTEDYGSVAEEINKQSVEVNPPIQDQGQVGESDNLQTEPNPITPPSGEEKPQV